jgi:hypothetical protein
MQVIGSYYANSGVYKLYKSLKRTPNAVSNIYYYDLCEKKYYSPNMKNLSINGRDMCGYRKPGHYWATFITEWHDSMVK